MKRYAFIGKLLLNIAFPNNLADKKINDGMKTLTQTISK